MRKLLILSALLGLGCDDPEVVAKVEGALVRGAVEAHVECAQLVVFTGCSNSAQSNMRLRASKLLDGSSLVSWVPNTNYYEFITQFNPRGSTVASCKNQVCIELADGVGDFVGDEYDICQMAGQSWSSGPVSGELDLSSCSGFNLEAFGVEP
jgi:hypothetical protein